MRGRAALFRRIDEIKANLDRPRVLIIEAVLQVHDHSVGRRCPCCGSINAYATESRVLVELAIDLLTGDRFKRDEVSDDVWAGLEQSGARRRVEFRCSRSQEPLLLDESNRHLLASGGNRSGKTTLGLYWFALQWLLRGGRLARFWLVASTLPKAFRLLEKLFKGTGKSPPVLPMELASVMPGTARASDLLTTLADGSLIDLKYFEGDPGAERLKSDAIVAGLVDEAAHLPTVDSLTALRGRCFDEGQGPGRLYLATTPRPASILKAEVVDPAKAFELLAPDDERRVTGAHEGFRWRMLEMSLLDNPWLGQESVQMELRAADKEDPSVLRDFFGKWVSNAGPLWRDFSVDKHMMRNEARRFSELGSSARAALGVDGLIECTPKIVRLIAGRKSPHYRGMVATNTEYVLGQDVNCHPLSTVVVSFACDPAAPDDTDRWHVFVWDVVQTFEGNSWKHAEKLASTRFARIMRPVDDASSLLGACLVCDSTAITRDPTAHRWGADPHGLPETFGKLGFDVRAPSYTLDVKPRNPSRYDSHLLLHRLVRPTEAHPAGRLHVSQRCQSLVESLLEQDDSGDGVTPATKSHTRSDVLASPVDALRYVIWAAFHGGRPPVQIRQAG